MTTLAQFEAMVPFAKPVELYQMLDQGAAERSATRDRDPDVFRLTSYYNARQLIIRIYEKLTTIAHSFLVDPTEISLTALRAKSIRLYDLVRLADAAERDFVVPVASSWIDPPPLNVRRYNLPYDEESLTILQYPRPHLRRRLDGEYFRQAAEMLAQLRYYAPTPLETSIIIPECARGNSVSHIYSIGINGTNLDDSTSFLFNKIWSQYLAPGRYYRDFFNLTTDEEFPKIIFAGYVDLQNNLQFFTP